MILLDTNALLWLLVDHPRAAPLRKPRRRLYLSPVTLLELRFLQEVGRLAELPGRSISELGRDPRWLLDDPSSEQLFAAAAGLAWTRDPFDRLIAAHARCRRWPLATGDRRLLEHLSPNEALAL